MNSRSSVTLVGLFLAILWIFGVLRALSAIKHDETLVMPDFAARADKFAIDRVVVSRSPKGGSAEEYAFSLKDETWSLRQGEQSIKVEGFRVKEMIEKAREAKRDAEAAKVLINALVAVADDAFLKLRGMERAP